MFFYVATKSIFNTFAEIQIPMDRWSVIDVFCAFTNISCLSLLGFTLQTKHIIDMESKFMYNMLQLMIVFATWGRIIGISLVV